MSQRDERGRFVRSIGPVTSESLGARDASDWLLRAGNLPIDLEPTLSLRAHARRKRLFRLPTYREFWQITATVVAVCWWGEIVAEAIVAAHWLDVGFVTFGFVSLLVAIWRDRW